MNGRACANAAEVASQIVRPLRSSGMKSPFGTRTPEVVPFQVKTTSRSKSTWLKSGSFPYSALNWRTSPSFNCLTASVTHPEPKLSQASRSVPRSPSNDHMAISTAPVSEAGTMPIRYSTGTRRISRVRSIACASLDLPVFARCERPSAASASACGVQPGRLAHGPDENRGLAGRRSGFAIVFIMATLPDSSPSLGRGVPPPPICLCPVTVKHLLRRTIAKKERRVSPPP